MTVLLFALLAGLVIGAPWWLVEVTSEDARRVRRHRRNRLDLNSKLGDRRK